jgi:hypothetical protein
MRRHLVVLLAIIVAVGAILLAAYLVHRSGTTAPDKVCAQYHIPDRSCARAKAAGYYCPSWDNTSGRLSPLYCITIGKGQGIYTN